MKLNLRLRFTKNIRFNSRNVTAVWKHLKSHLEFGSLLSRVGVSSVDDETTGRRYPDVSVSATPAAEV